MPASLDTNTVIRRSGTMDDVPTFPDLLTHLYAIPVIAYNALSLPSHQTKTLAKDKSCAHKGCKEPRHVTKGGIVDSMCTAHAKARSRKNGENYRKKMREAKAKGDQHD